MARAVFLAALGATLWGCPISPTLVDLRIQIDGGEVRYIAHLRDVRVVQGGLVESLPVFVSVATPSDDMHHENAWLAQLQLYRWARTDAGVDLELQGVLPRATFEACARAACPDAGRERCGDFPLKQCGSGYEMLFVEPVDPHSPARKWPNDAGVLTFRVRPTKDTEVAYQGDSARHVFDLWTSEPTGVDATVVWMKSYQDAYLAGDTADAGQVLAPTVRKTAAHGHPELERTLAEKVRRERQGLLYEYLTLRVQGTAAGQNLEPPPASDLRWLSSRSSLIPPKALPEAASLKLRVAYDVAEAGYLKGGDLKDSLPLIREVCGAKGVQAAPANKKFCDLLLLGP